MSLEPLVTWPLAFYESYYLAETSRKYQTAESTDTAVHPEVVKWRMSPLLLVYSCLWFRDGELIKHFQVSAGMLKNEAESHTFLLFYF